MPTTGRQLYPLSRLATLAAWELGAVLSFAQDDHRNPDVIYSGMDRAETIATANRTIADVTAHQNYRAAMASSRQATLDELHTEALAQDARMRDTHEGCYAPHPLPFGVLCADARNVIWERCGDNRYRMAGTTSDPIPTWELEPCGPFVASD